MPVGASTEASLTEQRLMSCRSNEMGEHFVTLFNTEGKILWNIPLPARGHGLNINSDGHIAVVFARRPGEFMWVLDLMNHEIVSKIAPQLGRHFYGHGVMSQKTGMLYTTENDYDAATGKIGLYDMANGFKRVDEIDSGGVGPHE
ncbi:MAG: DUF1513 domain-containing protein, partial [Arenicellales bacterium]